MKDFLVIERLKTMTEGEWLVGKSFNPGGHKEVDRVKELGAQLIDYVQEVSVDVRCMDLAVKALEDGCMWAVKGVTKPGREG